jgi:hypothetical protein
VAGIGRDGPDHRSGAARGARAAGRGGALRSGTFPYLLALLVAAPSFAESKNGFALDGARVPAAEIVDGGPGRDGIKSVDRPAFATSDAVDWVAPANPVLGVALGGEARAYPVHVMDYHQIVNDEIGGRPVAVTYDPLAGVPRAFDARVEGKRLRFGVSGLLHNHNFLLYDRETESLWLQFTGEALSGPLAGKRLAPLAIRQERYATWRSRHPKTRVLERPFPKQIDYRYTPFKAYIVQDSTLFPVKARDGRFHAKEMVCGVVVDGKPRAYLGSLLTAAGGEIDDTVAGKKLHIAYDTEEAVFMWDVPEDVEVVEAYWLAWKAFHPDTSVWNDPETQAPTRE